MSPLEQMMKQAADEASRKERELTDRSLLYVAATHAKRERATQRRVRF